MESERETEARGGGSHGVMGEELSEGPRCPGSAAGLGAVAHACVCVHTHVRAALSPLNPPWRPHMTPKETPTSISTTPERSTHPPGGHPAFRGAHVTPHTVVARSCHLQHPFTLKPNDGISAGCTQQATRVPRPHRRVARRGSPFSVCPKPWPSVSLAELGG